MAMFQPCHVTIGTSTHPGSLAFNHRFQAAGQHSGAGRLPSRLRATCDRRADAPLLFAAVLLPHALYVASIGGDHFEFRPVDLYFPFLFILMGRGAAALAAPSACRCDACGSRRRAITMLATTAAHAPAR